jgi:carbamoyl-phosphate synthase small subunit
VTPARLVLRSGRVFRGEALGAVGEAWGEVIFNTAMAGYQEILTDPSYRGQIVTMTYPLIGNYGLNEEDAESRRPWVNGFVVKEAARAPSSWRGRVSLDEYLRVHGVVGIEGIDTRALTRHLRDQGVEDGLISSIDLDESRLRDKARRLPGLVGRDLVREVTAEAPFTWAEGIWDPERGYASAAAAPCRRVIAYDAGIKLNILRQMASLGCKVTVVPATTPGDDVLALRPDGVFISNGPGDP